LIQFGGANFDIYNKSKKKNVFFVSLSIVNTQKMLFLKTLSKTGGCKKNQIIAMA
jgi:hypothetical protein